MGDYAWTDSFHLLDFAFSQEVRQFGSQTVLVLGKVGEGLVLIPLLLLKGLGTRLREEQSNAWKSFSCVPLYLVLVQYGTLVLLIPALKEIVIFGKLSNINRSQTCPCCNLTTGEGFTCAWREKRGREEDGGRRKERRQEGGEWARERSDKFYRSNTQHTVTMHHYHTSTQVVAGLKTSPLFASFTVPMGSPGVPVIRILGRLRPSTYTLAMLTLARGCSNYTKRVPLQNKINVKSNRQSYEVGLRLKPREERQKLPSVAIVETVKWKQKVKMSY